MAASVLLRQTWLAGEFTSALIAHLTAHWPAELKIEVAGSTPAEEGSNVWWIGIVCTCCPPRGTFLGAGRSPCVKILADFKEPLSGQNYLLSYPVTLL